MEVNVASKKMLSHTTPPQDSNFTLSASFVSQILKIPIKQMINLYVGGSRLYNCHSPNSDFDIFLIVKDETELPKVDHLNWCEMEPDDVILETMEKVHGSGVMIEKNLEFSRAENCISFRSNHVDVNIYKEKQFIHELENYIDCSIFEYASLSHYKPESDDSHEHATRERAVLLENKKYYIQKVQTSDQKSAFRRPFSRKSANSYVKCKKKICVEKDLRVGLKSLFHSLRIIMFAIQILKFGYVKNFEEANEYFEDIVTNRLNREVENYDELWNELDSKYKMIKKELEKEFHTLAPKIGIQKPQKLPKKK